MYSDRDRRPEWIGRRVAGGMGLGGRPAPAPAIVTVRVEPEGGVARAPDESGGGGPLSARASHFSGCQFRRGGVRVGVGVGLSIEGCLASRLHAPTQPPQHRVQLPLAKLGTARPAGRAPADERRARPGSCQPANFSRRARPRESRPAGLSPSARAELSPPADGTASAWRLSRLGGIL